MSKQRNVLCSIVFALATPVGGVEINFDDLDAPINPEEPAMCGSVLVTDQYRGVGVVFDGLAVADCSPAWCLGNYEESLWSPPHAGLLDDDCAASLRVVMTFVEPGTCRPAVTQNVVCRIYDSNEGTTLFSIRLFGIDGRELTVPETFVTPPPAQGLLAYSSPTGGIHRVELTADSDGSIIDDIEFDEPVVPPGQPGNPVIDLLGDEDSFGFRHLGKPVPRLDFDNRELEDPLFTDVDARLGGSNDVTWTHDLRGLLKGFDLTGAEIQLAIGGIQHGELGIVDQLIVDGMPVSGAFGDCRQGPMGTALCRFPLSGEHIETLDDGLLEVRIDGGAAESNGELESYFLDYSRVILFGQGAERRDHVLGDWDFFGFAGMAELSRQEDRQVPRHDFDNNNGLQDRDGYEDPDFTDHDARCPPPGHHEPSCPSQRNDLAWTHDVAHVTCGEAFQFQGPTFVLEIGIGGIQDGDPSIGIEDRVFIEGIEVPRALDDLNQGALGAGVVCFALSEEQVSEVLKDDLLQVRIEGGTVAKDSEQESLFVDFSRVRMITFVRGDCDGDGRTDSGDECHVLKESLPFPVQLPGDCNQDGVLDISDAVCVFRTLFTGEPARFPCGDGTPGDPGNRSLLDWHQDGTAVNVSDGIALLQYHFRGGQPHRLAVIGAEDCGCVVMPGCPDGCGS